jgi:glycosyltransferase involved in cell wall biosynthesis
MRLLIITQKIDRKDPVLGFFHGWAEEFAKYFERIVVICLEVGEHNLPENVRIFSLGKEKRNRQYAIPKLFRRLSYIFHFYARIIQEKKNYDKVFIHMNQEYVLLGGVLWRLWGKKVGLWYNHTAGGFFTRAAGYLAHIVFHTSPFAYTARFKNARQMPAGIDINKFKNQTFKVKDTNQNLKLRILYLGRISPLKKIDLLLKAAFSLVKKKTSFVLDVYGNAPARDAGYYSTIQQLVKPLEEKGLARLFPGVSHNETPSIYSTHDLFVNLTPRGNFDKTVLEAMACETLVLVSSEAFKDLLPEQYLFREDDPEDLARAIAEIAGTSPSERSNAAQIMRKRVVEKHSLAMLAERLADIYRSNL